MGLVFRFRRKFYTNLKTKRVYPPWLQLSSHRKHAKDALSGEWDRVSAVKYTRGLTVYNIYRDFPLVAFSK